LVDSARAEQQREAFLQEQLKLKSALSKSAESKTRNQDQSALGTKSLSSAKWNRPLKYLLPFTKQIFNDLMMQTEIAYLLSSLTPPYP
jgi:hypothetical protein